MSGTTNPNIILGVRPNAVSGPDFGAMVANSQQLLQFRQQQDQVQRQNALMGIFKDPNALDATGNPTPETLQKVGAIDPPAMMQLRQNMLIGQQTKLRTEALSSDLMAKKMEMIGEAAAPVLEHYKEQVAAGVPEEQARREAQSLLIQANERLKGSGVFVEDDYKRFPTQFDPIQMETVVAGTKQYQDWLKQRRDEAKEKREEEQGQWHAGLGPNDKGEQVAGMWFTPKIGGQPKFYPGVTVMPPGGGSAAAAKQRDDAAIAEVEQLQADGKPVPPDKLQAYKDAMARRKAGEERAAGVTTATTTARTAAGGGSVASQDLQATRDIVTEEWKQAHGGKPPDMNDPKQKADFELAVQARTDKRKADLAGAQTGQRIAAGGGSVAGQDREALKRVVQSNFETELGHPVTSPAEKTELDRRLLAAEDARKTTLAADTAAARQAAITKFWDITVDGVPQQGIQKYGKWFKPDGVTPIQGDVQFAATTRANRALEDREKIAADNANAGVPETPDQKASVAAQVATGEPMTQIIPGWGAAARKAQREARQAAIELIRDQTGMNAIDAGVELANRGIEYASGKKAEGIQTTMLATTRTAVKQLDYNIDKAREEMRRLKSTDISPVLNAILRKQEEWSGDPALASLFYSLSAVGMESARILSGGSASIQQLHEGAAKEAQKWVNIGMTPASFEDVARTISDEGKARLRAWEEGLKETRIGGQPTSGNTAPQNQQTTGPIQIPPALADASKAGKLAHNADGTVFYNTETKKYYDKTGKETVAPGAAQPAQQTAPAAPAQTPPAQTAPAAPAQAPARPAAPASKVARPTTKAEFDKLPSGTIYVNPADGKTYLKK